MRIEVNNIEELNKVSSFIGNKFNPNTCIILDGPMGAGKTTFTKNLLKNYGTTALITSPTFTIMNQYFLNEIKINHIDAYRLTFEEDSQMYLEEMINSFNIVEWSQNLDINYEMYFEVIKIKIEIVDEEKRIFYIEGVN
ncbi:tRNA (adenosine(37)-N6)-threonylcarbamoyltransferase complex ATPase subunit type 1 TsaE [Spiroplasma diminutum]|uniref:tRNA threonylcarbamoyladenosine biosynthesis protein TsaE n=1 Tax=Spiroplasma diminutum CUAS-1 TaxID=1276221 RepID=S5MDS0_9MOLU|nr:tRNA (adenosine(37)-N6)-threonylcarbamoyltransferase complex ATPase subunit type 1 TsaE [Spiroplasma diminutum]AGR41863.1 hypothetical protein SDIMI_v3c01590 [Spiroplasma diminutum CUAS-1]